VLWRVAQLLYLMAPAYCANMAPPFVHLFPVWNRPISERWLGSHKTVGGVLAGLGVALVTALIQWRIRWRGALLLMAHRAGLSWWDIGITLAVSFFGDVAVNQLAFRLGIRDTAW
jgi:CDP-2,3-bis-(O-geranylgeranyl)-sn-glycerol synthase